MQIDLKFVMSILEKKKLKKLFVELTNAKEGLITIYAPPGAIIPKNKTKLVVAKIRNITSYGMLMF